MEGSSQQGAHLANDTGNGRPLLREVLNSVASEATSKWRILGAQLLKPHQINELDVIAANHSHDDVSCCKRVFEIWLSTNIDATWNKLVQALENVQLDRLADQLKLKLSAVKSVDVTQPYEKLANTDTEEDFAKILIKLKLLLIRNNVDVAKVIERLCTISVVTDKKVPLFVEEIFEKVKSFDDLWKKLKSLLIIFNNKLLCYIVEISECKEAQDILKNFLAKFDPSATEDVDLALHSKMKSWEETPMPVLRIKMKSEICTSDKLNRKNAEMVLSKIYRLSNFALYFQCVKNACELVYYISQPLKLYLLQFKVTGTTMAELFTCCISSICIDEFELKVPSKNIDLTSKKFTWLNCRKDSTTTSAEKHGRKKPLIQRSNVNQLSHQALQDGIKNSDSVHCEDNKTQDTCSHNMDTIQEAYAYHKSDRQKNFLMLVKSDNHGELNVKYQFLKADDIPKMAVVCKQPQIFEDKAVCFIDISDYEKQCLLNLLLNKEYKIQLSSELLHSKDSNTAAYSHNSDPAKGRKLNYDELEDRMKTFKLPPEWHGPLDYQSMAEAGFVYTGQEDLVFCFHCNIKLDRWSKDMEPLLRHKEESPTCSFMRQRLQAVKGERGKTKSVVAPSKPLNSRLTSSIGQLQSSSLVTSKSIHTVVTGLNEPRLSYGGSFDDRPGASLPITPENYQSEAERIKSFVGWPLNEAVHPEQLACVGFVYTGEGALVQCFQCGVKYRHWYKGDVPLNVHQKCNPRCAFLQTLVSKGKSSPPERRPTRSYIQPESLGSNAQNEEVSKHSLQFPDYSDQAIRLQSFKHWGGVLPAQELAEGGFYMIARRDVVKCFSCKVVLQDWERSDNVIDEHHRFSPNCSFLLNFSSRERNNNLTSLKSSNKISFQNSEPTMMTQNRQSQQLKSETLDVKNPPLDLKVKNTSKTSCDDDDDDDDDESQKHIPGLRYPPSWRSNPPKLPEDSNESSHSFESQPKNDYCNRILSSIYPTKTGIQYEESLSEGMENNISIKTSDTKGDDMGAPGICQICYDKKIDCIFLPCGHARTCEGCATRIKNSGQPCPYCRKGVSTTYRIYL